MTIATIIVNEKFLQLFGSGTLIGTLAGLDTTKSVSSITEVILKFPRPSRQYLEKNQGPHEIILCDHVIPLLIKDLMWLTDHNIKYRIEYFTTDYNDAT